MLKCLRCQRRYTEPVVQCVCGFRFDEVPPAELNGWFDEVRSILETAYMQAETPWNQSGKSGSYEDWVRLRIPIAECIDTPGTFLDIGCANGYLLQCLLEWTTHKQIAIEPSGLDYSAKMVALAQARLPQYADRIYHGNTWDWQPPHHFDYVRTELAYVPANLHLDYLRRLLDDYLAPGGRLLVAQYRSRHEDLSGGWIDGWLTKQGFDVERCTRGFSSTKREQTRIAILRGA